MAKTEEIIRNMKKNPKNIRVSDLEKVCNEYFGEPRTSGSHKVYKTPWKDDPRVNIQGSSGNAKIYQVKQVLKAIDKLEGMQNDQQ